MSTSKDALTRSFSRLRKNSRSIRGKPHKVFCIGFNKTGTTSLHELFCQLGLRSYHGIKWRYMGNTDLLNRFDCFSDGIPDDFRMLDSMFPNSKFILQVRNLDEWVASRLEHIRRRKQTGIHKITGAWDDTDFAVSNWLKERNNHHVDVLGYFIDRPADLMLVNFVGNQSAASLVCGYLGYQQSMAKPHRNKNPSPYALEQNRDEIYSIFRNLGVPDAEFANDILCPSLMSAEIRSQYPADTADLANSRWQAFERTSQ